MSHLERRQREKEEVRQRIINAARSIACKDGWHAVTIRKIADAIEYTPPIVYEHFENKEDLIRELVYTGFEIMYNDSKEARKNETDPKKLLMKLSLLHWDFAFNNTDLFQLMFSLERPTPNDKMTASINFIESVFAELANHNEEIIHELIFGWMCLMNGAISFCLKTACLPRKGKKTQRELYESVMQRFINGI
jgi:AcrR family transcriptional regulator